MAASVNGLWEGMVRRGNGVVRAQRPGQFYPIYVDPKEGRIVDAGPPIPLGVARRSVPPREGLITVWPIKPRGIEGFWQLGRDSLLLAAKDGTAKASRERTPNAWTVKYMKDANATAVRDGRIKTVGYEPNGDRILEIPDDFLKPVTPKTVWFRQSHDASVHGARLLTQLLPGRSFPFPKSLYAVEDAIRFAVRNKPNAVVLDFFGGSRPDAIAHVFGEHEPFVLGSRTIDWVYPESIQAETEIRVVLAKEAISTGWDCPRAEVLYSERPAKDATHIAQVIGRMVRQPLAHRIATDDALNSVSCYLPLFDRKAVTSIKNELEGKGGENGESKVGPEIVRAPRVFERNPKLSADVFEFIETLPSIPTPDASASPVRRAKHLVRLLADDASGHALLADADALLTKRLNAKLDGLAAEYSTQVAANVTDIRTVDVHTSKVTTQGQDTGASSRQLETHAKDMDRDTRRIINSVKDGVGKGYYAHRVSQSDPETNKLDIRIEVAALLLVDGVTAEIETTATKFVQERLTQFKVEIKNTTGATRDAYRTVEEQTASPEALTVELRTNEKSATKSADGDNLPTFRGHIYADADGQFPVQLNEWEREVIATEIARPSFVAWYRNPQRATPNSLRIAYQDESGRWSSLQSDFLILSRRDDGTLAASIVDPHGDHLADAKAKLRALAGFAEQYGDRFLRIESVARASDGVLRSLDVQDANVRKAVREFEGGKVSPLYVSTSAVLYK